MKVVILEQKKGSEKMIEAKLYFRYGVMGAGKTRDLQKHYYSYKEDGKEVVIMKPIVDTKGEDKVIARDNQSNKVDFIINKEDNIYLLIAEYIINNNLDYILVDEAQFLKPEQIEQLSNIVDYLEIPVICYGIRTDFLNKLFPGGEELFAIADVREEIAKTCSCGRPSICNIRFTKEGIPVFSGNQVEIDGEEFTYKSMCRRCAKTLKKTKK